MIVAMLIQIRSSLPQSTEVHIKPLNLSSSSLLVFVWVEATDAYLHRLNSCHIFLCRAFLYLPYKAICLPLYNPPTFILKNVWEVIVFVPKTFLQNLDWIVKKGVYLFEIICKAAWISGSWSHQFVSEVSTNFLLH